MMIVVAVLLAIAEWVGKRERSMEQLGIGDALAVGCAQVLALIPGSSRSGSTIMGGLFAGLTRETAARFSFLLSIPAIAASGLLELKEAIHKLPDGSLSAVDCGDNRFRRGWLRVDLVSAAISANPFHRRLHRLPLDRWRRHHLCVAGWLHLGQRRVSLLQL